MSYAIDWISFVIEHNPNNPTYLSVYAKILSIIGLIDKAIEIQKKAADLNSEDTNITLSLQIYQNFKELQKKISF